MALAVLVLFCFFLLLLRFVWLQVVRHSNYVAQAEENRISIVPTMPSRGIITDRNGVVLASNQSVCTVSVIHSQIEDEEAVIELFASDGLLVATTRATRPETTISVAQLPAGRYMVRITPREGETSLYPLIIQ